MGRVMGLEGWGVFMMREVRMMENGSSGEEKRSEDGEVLRVRPMVTDGLGQLGGRLAGDSGGGKCLDCRRMEGGEGMYL